MTTLVASAGTLAAPRVAPLSFAQQGIWLEEQRVPNTAAYHVPVLLQLRGCIEWGALFRALRHTLARHDVFRTVLEVDGRDVRQRVLPGACVTPCLVDLRDLPAGRGDEVAQAVCAAEGGRPFALTGAPLVRITIVREHEETQRLLLVMHHLITDAWSIGILTQELATIYAALVAGRGLPTLEKPLPYADYAARQQRALTAARRNEQLAYWMQQLDGASPTQLPADLVRTGRAQNAGGQTTRHLTRALSTRLVDLGRRHGATLFMTLLAGFVAMLARYTRSRDIVVGTPVAGRSEPDVAHTVGLFVNTLVLRIRWGSAATFEELLQAVRDVALAAYDHQDLPFQRLVEEIRPDRTTGRHPLFDIAFVQQTAPSASVELPGLTLSPVGVDSGSTPFELLLSFEERVDGLALLARFNRDAYHAATIERLLEHLEKLLESAADAPRQPVAALQMLPAAEIQQLLGWGLGSGDYAATTSLPERFAQTVARHADAVAVTFEDQHVTYGALNRMADAVALRLRRGGVGPETLVGICLDRSPRLIASILGVLKAGGAYLPLDPASPAERLRFLVEDAHVGIVIVEQATSERLRFVPGALFVDIDDVSDADDAAPLPVLRTDSAHIAYVIYTSGTTGQPKGVCVTHHNVLRLFAATDDWFHFSAEDVCAGFHSYAFDFAVWEIFAALLHGGRLAIVPYWTSRSVADMERLLARDQITVFSQTPSAFARLLPSPPGASSSLASVRVVVFGGERLDPRLVSAWLASGSTSAQFVNMYGITETTVHVTYSRVGDEEAEQTRSIIGGAIPDLHVYVVDAHLRLVPTGAPGELCVGGEGVARGYLNRPGLTAERFVPDPFMGQGARMYRSGDLARWLPDGRLEFLGRVDRQVKIRGHRIELAEVEATLARHRDVMSALTVARQDARRGSELIAYVVPRAGARVDAAALAAFARELLPSYALPAAIVPVAHIPLTANGKPDLAALPAPPLAGSGGPRSDHCSATPLTDLVTGVFCEVLDAECVAPNDNFFELGGHSLLAMQLASRLTAIFGVEVPLGRVFEAGTPSAIAQLIDAALAERSGPIDPLLPVPRDTPRPLSSAQQRFWFAQMLDPDTHAYTIPCVWRLSGRLHPGRLRAAFREVVRRHEVLRTIFPTELGVPVASVLDGADFAVPLVDLSALPAQSRADAARSIAADDAARPFVLSERPPLRAMMVRIDATTHWLVTAFHHIAADAWSFDVFAGELAALYRGAPDGLPPLRLQYGDFAFWEQRSLAAGRFDRQRDYWVRQLANLRRCSLPASGQQGGVAAETGELVSFHWSPPTVQALRTACRGAGVTPFMALLTAVAVAVRVVSDRDDVAIATNLANRHHPETARLIGCFLREVTLRLHVQTDQPLGDLLEQSRRVSLEAYVNQDYPFEELVKHVAPARTGESGTFSGIRLDYENFSRSDASPSDLVIEPVAPETPTVRDDVTVGAVDDGDSLTVNVLYRKRQYARRQIGRFLRLIETTLAAIAEMQDILVRDIDGVASRARTSEPGELGRKLLRTWIDDHI